MIATAIYTPTNMSDQPIAPAKPELTIATAPLEGEPTLKKLRVEFPASPLSASLGSSATPQSPSSGAFVKVKTISRPHSQATIPSPSARSPQTPQSATSSASIATATTPLTSSSVPLHSADLLDRWAAALTRSMMKHWPKDEEPQVLTMMRRVAARVPGAAGVAAGQVRALLTAFQDPKNEKLRGDVMFR
ncbi:Hypothetical protein, putative [Bodo saltans]|uniref:Uncharacterized protein n=1 Tax=Bodo saltans TaxID=75058 RepID=A0A0S4IZS8_BODSA|nr:Hypothetical protein, putative [Bodo saltans]|eukprot:CUG69230.1 Hypothetical protein, putative [Bodo saltans]